jgi:hypothetical protein
MIANKNTGENAGDGSGFLLMIQLGKDACVFV